MEDKNASYPADSIPEKALLETEEMSMPLVVTPKPTQAKGLHPGLLSPKNDPFRTDVRYSFSDHARVRLQERSSLMVEQVLALLEDGAYERLARRIDKAKLYENPKWAGLTLEELRQRGVDTQDYCYKHVLIWSEPDQKAFTLIIAVKSRRVVTVLVAEDVDNGVDWSDKVTPEAIRRAQERQAESMIPAELRARVYARVSWTNSHNQARGKNLPGASFTKNDLPIEEEALLDLVNKALVFADDGINIHLQLISKENGANLEAEYLLVKDDLGMIEIQPVPV